MSARGLLPGLLLVVMWSSGFIGAELGTRQAPASTLLAWRYLIAGVLLIGVCIWRRERIDRAGVRRQIVLGLLCQVAFLGCVVSGVGLGVPAGTTALIAAMQPLVVIVLAAIVLSERVRVAQLIGLTLGLLGVLLVVRGDLGVGDTVRWAYVLPVIGMLCLASGTVLQQRWRPTETLLTSMAVQTVTAGVVFWILAVVEGTAGEPTPPAFWVAVAWVVLLSSFGGYGAYVHVSRTQGATRASTLLYLTPPTTMLWAALMFEDRVPTAGLVGIGLCAVGVVIALRAATKPRAMATAR
jgi:drug/metabolite transporter (DMT)-like permease